MGVFCFTAHSHRTQQEPQKLTPLYKEQIDVSLFTYQQAMRIYDDRPPVEAILMAAFLKANPLNENNTARKDHKNNDLKRLSHAFPKIRNQAEAYRQWDILSRAGATIYEDTDAIRAMVALYYCATTYTHHPFASLIMATILTADTPTQEALTECFPEHAAELKARQKYAADNGRLPCER